MSATRSKRRSATLIGAFVVVGLMLAAALLIVVGGGDLFSRRERVVMYFNGSIYGLQIGAPVVFRGVRLGQVSAVGVAYDKQRDEFNIPVQAELEPAVLRRLVSDQAGSEALQSLVERGLRAQLSMQSLLTGQLYVDLDLRPDKPSQQHAPVAGMLEIPTVTTALQDLKNQFDGLELRRLVDDVNAIASATRGFVNDERLHKALADLGTTATHMRSLSAELDKRGAPMAQAIDRAAAKMGAAADQVSDTAQRYAQTAERLDALLAPDSPLLASLRQTSEQLGRLAQSLRQQTGESAPLVLQLDETLRDVSRAARALRELTELLDRRPDALLRGRGQPPQPPAPASEKRP